MFPTALNARGCYRFPSHALKQTDHSRGGRPGNVVTRWLLYESLPNNQPFALFRDFSTRTHSGVVGRNTEERTANVQGSFGSTRAHAWATLPHAATACVGRESAITVGVLYSPCPCSEAKKRTALLPSPGLFPRGRQRCAQRLPSYARSRCSKEEAVSWMSLTFPKRRPVSTHSAHLAGALRAVFAPFDANRCSR